ncbi:hypothetical protein [Streptomyces atratus]|uniref:hypothetical protein n=1 Tax=Streptomyces atratus TaxID=1893 RepID=UPI002AC33632|nr:hypothetical protein [Streptomyces atratus]WPW29171.1 hypothetical protein P6B95_18480 [Streptomyces atratus]
MAGSTQRRAVPVKAWAAAGVGLVLLGTIAAWFFLGREVSPPCNGLAEDASVQKSVGVDVHPGMNCTALGEAIAKATAGSEPGRHTQAQAQAMKDVLFALGSGQSKKLDLDPALRVPLATALADYAPDLHEMLAGLDSEYVLKAGQDTPPWEVGGIYHMSVHNTVFRKTLRAVAEDPQAYALLRMAETRTAAERLAAVPEDATGTELSLPPTKNARALGILNGIADAATHGKDKDQARAWRAAVLNNLLDGQASPKSDQDPHAAHLTTAWLQNLKNASEEERFDRLRTQGVDMARTWSQDRKMDEQTQQGLLAKVEGSALSAYREIKP